MSETPYDKVVYASFPYRVTHPDHLGVIGELFGMSPARPEACRLLEIGCAGGGNLLPMAEAYPESRFVGIDLAALPLEEGRADAAALGLRNVELLHLDVVELARRAAELGPFDFVVSHGVYSWIPPAARVAMLEATGRLLAPQGVAYISHNVKPGWFLRTAARQMMRWWVDAGASPTKQVEQARGFIEFIASSARDERWRGVVTPERDDAFRSADWFVFHDQLGEINDACWFHELAGELPAHGLQFLSDSELSSMFTLGWPAEIVATLDKVAPDLLKHQQLLDMVRGRGFRMTLMVRAEVKLERAIPAGMVERWSLAARLRPDAKDPQTFNTPTGGVATTNDPTSQAALRALGDAWPRALPFAGVLAAAGPDAVGPRLADDLLQCVLSGVVRPSRTPPPCSSSRAIPARPRARPLARRQAERSPYVTTLWHDNAKLDVLSRRLLALLDGTRDLAALEIAMREGDDVLHTTVPDLLAGLAEAGYLLAD